MQADHSQNKSNVQSLDSRLFNVRCEHCQYHVLFRIYTQFFIMFRTL